MCLRVSAPCRKEMATLQKVKAKLLVGEQKLRDMQWEHEVLEQRFRRLRAERDDLYEKFQDALYDVQQKAGFKGLLLQKKLDVAHGELEKKEAHLTEVRGAPVCCIGVRHTSNPPLGLPCSCLTCAGCCCVLEPAPALLCVQPQILASANLEPSVMGVLAKRLDEVVESKDSSIRELQSELQRVVAAHNRLISGYERKLAEYGIPAEELGFTPLRSS
jgi:hypothetical protein